MSDAEGLASYSPSTNPIECLWPNTINYAKSHLNARVVQHSTRFYHQTIEFEDMHVCH